ncbi:MAG: hypothetical protein VX341_01035 [Bdellovibrionota bacterium]|nr:hypothetical protein [Bdellovibrionota bacterium]
MKKTTLTLSLLFCISGITKAASQNFKSYIERNSLVPCDRQSILDAEFLSFNETLRDANRIGKEDYHNTTFYFSDGSEKTSPSSLECFIQGIDSCSDMARINSVKVPKKTLFEIIQNNSEFSQETTGFNAPMGYGHASVTSTVGYLDIDVEAVAGKNSKLSKISEKLGGNYFQAFSRKYDATFYCRK